ncbi:MAG TPA: hypothetical protein IAB43_06475 [Candidatus Spyradocola merdavium]|nr:hypothetical protein [Candidatus Spyradocola merdavium]
MLDMLLNSSDELLPASGFLGFLVHHWLAVAIVILVLGFALDQLFYVLLDRPQDRWRRRYRALRAFLTAHFGAPALKEAASEDAGPSAEGPVIHRAGAKYNPNAAPRVGPQPAPGPRPEPGSQPASGPRPEPGSQRAASPARPAPAERRTAGTAGETVYEPLRRAPERAAEGARRFGQIVTPPPAAREEPIFEPLDEDAPIVVRPDEVQPRSAEPTTLRRRGEPTENGEGN